MTHICFVDEWVVTHVCFIDEWVVTHICFIDEWVVTHTCLVDKWVVTRICFVDEWFVTHICFVDEPVDVEVADAVDELTGRPQHRAVRRRGHVRKLSDVPQILERSQRSRGQGHILSVL